MIWQLTFQQRQTNGSEEKGALFFNDLFFSIFLMNGSINVFGGEYTHTH
jgi:hypothetical protein